MYGVVLWSDCDQDRAVIWCEDHGDLAYYRGDGHGVSLVKDISAGDLVVFELRDGGELRLADAPRLVGQKTYPTLSSDLKNAVGGMERESKPFVGSSAATVIPFQKTRCAEVA